MEFKIKGPAISQQPGDEYRQYDAAIADVDITDFGLPTSDSQVAGDTAIAIAQTKIPPMVTAKTLESLGYPTTYSRGIVRLKSSEPKSGVVRSGSTVTAYAFVNNSKLLPDHSNVISSQTYLTTKPISSVPETIEIVRITSHRLPELEKAA